MDWKNFNFLMIIFELLFLIQLICAIPTNQPINLIEQQPKEIQYDGYKVYRIYPETEDQLLYLKKLSKEDGDGIEDGTILNGKNPQNDNNDNNEDNIVDSLKIDFWSEPRTINSSIDLMISPKMEPILKKIFETKQFKTETLIDDVGKILENQKKLLNDDHQLQQQQQQPSTLFYLYQNDTIFFQRYQALSNIQQFMEDLVRSNPDFVSTEVIGRSTEGRSMKIIKIGYPRTDRIKPMVWLDAGIHAREWIAPATATFIMNKLIKTKSEPDTKDLLETFDFHILPSANPDGYEYSRLFDRFWRKTRSRNSGNAFLGFFCVGVDPNRNYGYKWRMAGSSNNPCSNTYHGPHPFSEPETKSISEHILQNKDRVKLFISLHSYSQLILTPWGWTRELPKDHPDMMRVAEIGSRALKMRYGTEYRYGSSTNILYAAAGGSDDWAHGAAGIKYSFTFELRDKGTYGFLLPPRFIQPSGEETFDALIAMLNEIKKEI